jgi:hypothetical protein
MRWSNYFLYSMLAVASRCFPSPVVAAAELTYAWSGRLVLDDLESPNPWQIGADGAAFVLQTSVSSHAIDRSDGQPSSADFTAMSAKLWVDGEETLYQGEAYIDFSDRVDILDIVSASGRFSLGGETVEISSVIGLDPFTYSFVLPSEKPPTFHPTTTSTKGTAGGHPYFAIVGAGVPVTVTPEPGALSIVIAAAMVVAVNGRRNCSSVMCPWSRRAPLATRQ